MKALVTGWHTEMHAMENQIGLLRIGRFKLHSGEESDFKIDVDAFDDESIAAAAFLLAKRVPSFSTTYGIPAGGLRLADAMRPYATYGPVLICDDVYTTGRSMEQTRESFSPRGAVGAVIFARNPVPSWISTLFVMP